MSLSFPSNPTLGQQSTQNGRTYTWTGSVWEITTLVIEGPTGPAGADGSNGAVGATGPTGPVGPAAISGFGTSPPTGGNDGDIYLQYAP